MVESKPIESLGGRTWAELEAIRGDDGHLLIPDELRQRNARSGKFESVPVLVRVPRAKDILIARADARVWMSKFKGLDPERDSDVFDEMEQLCLLARAIRDPKTKAQLEPAEDLSDKVDDKSLEDLLGRLQVYRDLTDPRESDLTEEQLWTRVAEVVRAGHLGPLTGIAGPDQPSCVLFMAHQALQSPKGRAFVQSLGSSTPAPSESQSSKPSSGGRG
jgi:hypothetical protein